MRSGVELFQDIKQVINWGRERQTYRPLEQQVQLAPGDHMCYWESVAALDAHESLQGSGSRWQVQGPGMDWTPPVGFASAAQAVTALIAGDPNIQVTVLL